MPKREIPDWEYVARFWARVTIPSKKASSCWEWQGKRHNSAGYGVTLWHENEMRCHRVSYLLAFGKIPDGALIRHLCHNPICVNPNHLAAGNKADNANDDWVAGKVRTGANRWSSKYTDAQVAVIRDPNKTAKEVAEVVGCSISYAYELRRNNDPHRRAETKRHQESALRAVERK